jgi:hypothetical protein
MTNEVLVRPKKRRHHGHCASLEVSRRRSIGGGRHRLVCPCGINCDSRLHLANLHHPHAYNDTLVRHRDPHSLFRLALPHHPRLGDSGPSTRNIRLPAVASTEFERCLASFLRSLPGAQALLEVESLSALTLQWNAIDQGVPFTSIAWA